MNSELSFLANIDTNALDELYRQYQQDPESVETSWKEFFRGFEFASKQYGDSGNEVMPDEFKVINLINGYRQRGHLFTKTNPVRARRKYEPTLDLENFGLSEKDLSRNFEAGKEIGIGRTTLKNIIHHLTNTYRSSIGAEYRFIRKPEVIYWLQNKMETRQNIPDFSLDEKLRIFQNLNKAVQFEKYIHKKFPGQKRFSLEGMEAAIPALNEVISTGAKLGTKEFIIGMPHRGRLNVLANILHKPYFQIFSEFEGYEYEDEAIMGDVKYHLGATYNRKIDNQTEVRLTLAPNPSHLEAVDPVVEGIARSRIDLDYNGDTKKVTPILLHGDASVAGQGVVYEVLQMSQLKGYRTGGTIHLVLNNQLGFTTNYLDGRSSTYSTDVAKIVQSPVFHVNGDDVEALVYTIKLAMEFRDKFQKDIFIDLLGYRKYGHNEGDEPRFTQPLLYKIISKHKDPATIYKEKLLEEGQIEIAQLESYQQNFIKELDENFEKAKSIEKSTMNPFLGETWDSIRRANNSDFHHSPVTAVDANKLREIADKITRIEENKTFYRKSIKLLNDRRKMVEQDKLDWAMGELLAYGSLVAEGIPVRVSGQDSERGTFSHRHAVITLEDSEEKYIPLQTISKDQAPFEIYNSPLSEYGVLGFEYGYSLASPHTLTIWEAQFGDFNNGGQIIIDQYLSSAEEKWNVMSDLVLLLPHGFEGQGPEHSSARMERFLSLAAENNMQITNPTTPANFFHLLRRQLYRDFRKPLIVFTPKSLLRHSRVYSTFSDLATGGFHEVIDDLSADPEAIEKVILCSGKVYYDLLAFKEKHPDTRKTAIVRIEQLYPLPRVQLMAIVDKYSKARRWVWVQEEPANMGAWTYMQEHFKEVDLKLISRPASGSPATGSSKFHQLQQQKILEKAFHKCNCHRLDEECQMVCIGNRWQSFEEEKQQQKTIESANS
jgi:2-oxoglutarate dehydrogenase E1 component